jgi:hypothetical protein
MSRAAAGDDRATGLRRPAWSGGLTDWLGARVPPSRRGAALDAIKAIHTVIFASVGVALGLFVWDGLHRRSDKRAAMALGVVLAETAVYISNNQVCPLTPLAEELGASRGAVVDMYLPGWAARRIPLIAGTALVGGIALHAAAILARPRAPAADGP